jgi:hypothetical protein
MKTTKTIAGRKITLTRGQRYMAGRPFASRGRKTYPVTIYQITNGFSFQNGVATIDGLTYDQANELLAAFNDGTTSFDGRVW